MIWDIRGILLHVETIAIQQLDIYERDLTERGQFGMAKEIPNL
jgi:hypothetical protein